MSLLQRKNVYQQDINGQANPKAIIQGAMYRFTVLTSKLIRMEYAADGVFEDRPTQSIWNRSFDVPEFRLVEDEENLQIITEDVHLYYKKGPFSERTLYVELKGNYSAYHSRWSYGMKLDTLKGTARTLDTADGAVELEDGVISKNGFSCIDDSKSLILTEDNWVEPRRQDVIDLYFFGYGRHYLEAIRDLYKLTGPTPLLPRQIMGNWWSRYWRYDEQEYKELITRFKAEDIPFSVSVVDMDWHLVDIPEKYGSGWTGYTWNKELFPDPKGFMSWLHDSNMWITLNLHPADGVRAHEEMYEPMAKELGVDYENEDRIEFDFSNRAFIDAYFKHLHHPQEADGVDFWWIDWQQGATSKMEGLDPLWMLNHYHAVDLARDGKRPLIFSRYAGVGSHRYPVGFSGDTVISWDSYDYQPYFTATASNIGYSWWSHDIGGHFMGAKDDELSTRWLQYGVFSPIMRLHSSCNIFNGKEPWRYSMECSEIMKEYLRLRHQLVPYLYTMNYQTHKELTPLVQPVYYQYPNEDRAYEMKNQYFFGSELMVCPITTKVNPKLHVASVKAWLPEGKWFDFFTGTMYSGGKTMRLFRSLHTQPVLAKAGAIVPMTRHVKHENSIENPTNLDVMIFPGADNTFELYEDNGIDLSYREGQFAITKMALNWSEQATFTISVATGDTSVVPAKRNLRLFFRGVNKIEKVNVTIAGNECAYEASYDVATQTMVIELLAVSVGDEVIVAFATENVITTNSNMMEKVYCFLDHAEIEFSLKDYLYRLIDRTKDRYKLMIELHAMDLEKDLVDALLEIILP
ncbi:MAG: TIM-barrel domain-containing protein [Bacillaceae bacterium]